MIVGFSSSGLITPGAGLMTAVGSTFLTGAASFEFIVKTTMIVQNKAQIVVDFMFLVIRLRNLNRKC